MLVRDIGGPERVSLNGVAHLSRRNLECAGLLLYFAAMAFSFAFALILMLLENGAKHD